MRPTVCVTHPPLVYEVGVHGGDHVLRAMARDGLLVRVGMLHYLRADAAGWPSARRVAVGRALGPGVTAALATAVWALGGPEPPAGPLTGIVGPRTGGRPRFEGCLRLHRTALAAGDTLTADGLTLTTPLRTAIDLTFLGGPAADAALVWLLRLIDVADLAAQVQARHRVPGVEQARDVVDLLAAGQADPLTRVRSAQARSGRRRTHPTPV